MKAAEKSVRPGWRYPLDGGLPKVPAGRRVRIRSALSQIYGVSDLSDMPAAPKPKIPRR